MDFLTGLTNLTNWFGNVIMPTLAGLFFVVSVLRFSRGGSHQYSMYAGFAALMVSGILRAVEILCATTCLERSRRRVGDVSTRDWSANVFLPLYG